MPAPVGNQYALGNKGGRPPKYDTAESLTEQIEAYFTYCLGESHEEEREREVGKGKNKRTEKYKVTVWDREPERPTWTKLALYLGFQSRDTLSDYGKKEEFSYPIKRALLVIESLYEDALMLQGPTGAIFALKNLKWSDKQEVEHSGVLAVNWNETKTYGTPSEADHSA